MKKGKKRKVEESPPASPPSSPPPPSPQEEDVDDDEVFEEFDDDSENYTTMVDTFMPVVFITNGNVKSKVPSKKRAPMKARVQELTAGVEQSLAKLLVPNCTLPNFDETLPSSNKKLKEKEGNLKQQLSDKRFEISQQRSNLKETQQYLEAYQEKSEKVKKAYKTSHKGKLQQSYRKYPDIDENPDFITPPSSSSFKPTTSSTNHYRQPITDDSFDKNEEEEEQEVDKELAEIKRKMAPLLAQLVNSQHSGISSANSSGLLSDSTGLFVGPSTHLGS